MSRRQFCVVGLFLALFALLYPPPYMGINAQQTPPDPTSSPVPTEPEQPDMGYQPPADADELGDFLPPEGEVLVAPPAEPISPTLPISPTTPLTLTTPITAVTAVTITTPITKLVSFEEGKVAVVFEEDTITDTAEIQLTTLPLPQNPLTATNTVSNPLESLVLQKFQIEVVQDGQMVSAEFSQPVRLIVDLRSLMQELDASYQTWNYYLAYQDETNPGIWIEVPIDVYQSDGLLSAEVMHFSNWAAGVRPERWNPSWTPPTVSTFSGAATYSYPLELPPGRHGLQPAVSLSYSSRGLDGRIRDGESGPIGDGWSIGDISVVRVGVEMENPWGTPWSLHPDKFRLVFNGTGHELFPAAGVNTTTEPTVRYYVKDAPGYYLERNYEANATIVPNQDGIYWILITPDGTRYRLGFTADAEEWQYTSHHSHLNVQGHIGRTHDNGAVQYSAIAWHVDTVTDAFGNQMTYHYHTWNTDENIQWWNTNHWTSFALTTRKNRINDIKYNYPTRVTDLPAEDTVARLTSTPATRITFRSANTTYYPTLINSIFIYHGGGALPISEYRIDTTGVMVDSPGCINATNTPHESHTRIVKSIRRWVNVDDNAATNDPNGYALPPTTFYYGNNLNNQNEYNPLRHFTWGGQSCFSFLYMHGYKNGYGGSVRFTYESDNRAVGEYEYEGNNQYEWPVIGFSYVVSEVRANDGRNADLRTTYSYTQPCYNQTQPVPAGAVQCNSLDASDYGNLVGYQTTTQTSYDYNGSTILNKQITTFSQNAGNSIGPPTQIDVENGAGTLLTRSSHTYASLAINGVANMFTYTSESKNYQYNGGNTLSTKTTYDYTTANQNGGQYGNLTHIREFDSASAATPIRTTVRWYYPRADLTGSGLLTGVGYWLIGAVGQEALYSGDQTTFLRGTWSYYDGSANPASTSNLPTQGALTRSRAYIPTTCAAVPGGGGSGCVHARQTIDTTYTYDVYGNQTSLTTYADNDADTTTDSDYGYRTFNSSWSQVYNLFPATANGRTTTITYDPTYNLYPISTSNALGTTTFAIYGFNGVSVSGFQKQPGLLKEVTAPDGLTTKYEYDPFGRLHAIFDGYSYTGFNNSTVWDGNPLNRYRYYDNSWNGTPQLDPANDQPFPIVSETRPGSSAISRTEVAYFDGFGRVIQNQTRSAQVEIGNVDTERDILTTTAYNAQGQDGCATVPYDEIPYTTRGGSSGFLDHACTGKAHTATTYDALARPLVVTAPDGTTTSYQYSIINTVTVDGASILAHTKVVDANNHVTGQFYNAQGQLVLVREYTGLYPNQTADADTRYSYNVQGNLTAVLTTNASNSQPLQENSLSYTEMAYDNYGRKVSMNDPDMGNWTYKYNAAGSLAEQRDANLARLCFTYDALNRLQYKRHDADDDGCESGDSQLAFYDYYAADAGGGYVGRLKEIRWSASGSTDRETFGYDTLGRLNSHTRIIYNRSYTMSYSNFDALHRPQTITYPNGQTSVTTYDREGPNTLANSGTNLISDVRYNGMGQLKYLQRSSGNIHTTYLYHPQNDAGGGGLGDSNFRLKTIQHGAAGTGNAWPDFTYEYDDVGNISTMTTLSTAGTDTQSFGYDHLNRLISASASGVSPTYSDVYGYNKIGNLTNNDGISQTYGSSSHVHAVTSAGGVTYGYDDNGNMISRDASGTTNDYTQNFNVENELASVVNNGSTTTFAYDASGIRVKTVAPNGTVTDYPFPGYEVESPTSNPTVRLTFSIAGQAVALKVMGSSTATYYLYNDHLGSTSTMSTTTGDPVTGSTARYYPFGNWRTEPTANLTDRGFTGHLHNNIGSGSDDIGLVYMNARWYLPTTGRFISADSIIPNPANPQSYNRYSYVLNRALNFKDPTGHISCTDSNLPSDDQQACQATPAPIWVRPFIDNPDWVKYYGHTNGSGYSSTNAGQHPGLDWGKFAQSSFGGTWNDITEQWDFDGTYDTPVRPRIPVYASCYCTVHSTGEGSPYAPGRVYLTHEDHPDFLLMNGHLMPNKYNDDGTVVIETNILVSAGEKVTPNTIIGYLEETERHVHVEIRRISDNHFENPFPYLSSALQVQLLAFQGAWPNTTYQPGYPSDPANQPDGYYP